MAKYDFIGIKKVGAASLKAVLTSTTWGASILASPFKPLIDHLLGVLVVWLANKGLLIINLGAIYVEGELDQTKFDKAMDEALEKLKLKDLTNQEREDIDNEVIRAFRNFARITRK